MNSKRFAYPILVAATVVFTSFSHGASTVAALPPSIIWSQQYGTSSHDDASGVSVDTSGNVYVTRSTLGSLGGLNSGGYDAYLSKYDDNGNSIWTKQFGTTGTDIGVKVSSDPFGNVFVTGRTTGILGDSSAGGLDGFISKFDSNGASIWTKQFGTTGDEYSTSVSTDNFGNAYIVGRTSGSLAAPSVGNFDVFVAKYESVGNRAWIKQFGTSTWDDSFGVSADALGNVFVVGDTEGSLDGVNAGSRDIYLRKYDASGNLAWRKQFGTSLWDKSFEASADGFGNVYFTGWTRGNLAGPNAGQYDAIVAKYDSDGNLLWRRQFGTSEYEYSFAVSTDALGSVYIAGSQGDFEASSTLLGDDAFLIKYSKDGDFLWNIPVVSSGREYIFGVAASGVGTAYAIGGSTGNLFGPNAGDYDAFIFKVSEVPEPSVVMQSLLIVFGSPLLRQRRYRARPF